MKHLLARLKRKPGSQKGQAAIEFIVCIVVLFFFLLFFLSLSILLVTSEYIDYATFMAARTLRSGYNNQATAERNAQRVFNDYMEKIRGIARNYSLNITPLIDPTFENHTAGVEASYDIDMFYLPPIFVSGNAPPSKIRLTAEAHLGRDPGYEECLQYFSDFGHRLGVNIDTIAEDMDDNGC